jgi:hypothetical protein
MTKIKSFIDNFLFRKLNRLKGDGKMIATQIEINSKQDFRGDARLYRLSEPLMDWDGNACGYVLVSACDVPYSGPETYIFRANANGDITDWSELEGSFRGGLDHAQALADAGYDMMS